MGFLSFTSWQFAAAGAMLAAGPLIIHLLNRRRHRVVQWAAMDFLRQAVKRNRRILQIRDIVLLILRTLAVLLFGLALARPYFAARGARDDHGQPLHAVLVIDNSLSMAYSLLEGTLLDKAKDRARRLIEQLPAGSRVSIIPAGGSRNEFSVDPYDATTGALEALDRIEIVDRSATLTRALNEVREACEAAPELPKRVVFFGDQQELNWRDARKEGQLASLPEMQVVSVAPAEWENTWISKVQIQDGLADVETPATVVVELQHRGLPFATARRDLQVTLRIGETVVGEKTVTLEPGQGSREVDFECLFSGLSVLPEPDRPIYVPLRASIAPDRLELDDERFLAVPVVAALGVVFIDQYGPEQEDPIRGRLGETRHLRKLLAPRASRSDAPRQLVRVRHITPDDLTQQVLSETRLVVVAGLREPGQMVGLLRDYVRQGGQLLITAGADFDPAAWNEAAWLNGQGILPLPLAPEPVGAIPEVARENLKPFSLAFDSLRGEGYFHVSGLSEADLRELYAEPFFFKAVLADASPPTLEAWNQAEAKRLADEANNAQQQALPPTWLTWAASESAESENSALQDSPSNRAGTIESIISANRPRVLATFDLPGRPALLVSRRIGRGEVVFCSTGVLSSWNTLPKTNAVLIFDRILRGMIQSTLPNRNFAPIERLNLPLPRAEQNLLVSLSRPGRSQELESLDVGYISPERRGITLEKLFQRGVYRLSGHRASPSSSAPTAIDKPIWETSIVVNGESEESDLTALTRVQLEELAAGGQTLRWVGPADEISLAGAAIRGQNSWWWLSLAVLALLLAEMSVLVWPTFRPQET